MYTWKSYYVVQADYQHWANEALFSALAHLRPETLEADQGLYRKSVHQTVDHMLAQAQLWLARLQGADPQVGPRESGHPVWRELLTALRLETRRLEKWLESRPDAFFEGEVHYTDSDGKARTMWVREVLNHLYTEYAHLRGEIAAVANRLGAPHAEIDYAHYRREMVKLLEEARNQSR
jgi:uncharacterized damage-inducible protein DinB